MKTRLVGALVLIALAVIFVPMLLPGNSGSGSSPASLDVPPEPSSELQTRVLQVGPDGASAGPATQAAVHDPDRVATLNLDHHPRTAPASAPQLVAGAPAIEPTTAPASAVVTAIQSTPPVSATVAKAAPMSAATPASRPVPASAEVGPLPGGAGTAAGAVFTVNLGIYADHGSANRLVANAKQLGYTALASPETFNGKSVLRVRVGPFSSRAEAEVARLKLKGVEPVPMSIDSAVVNQPADAPASALPAAKPGAWAVQLAAYGDQASANKLRDRLRAQGIDGYVDSVKTAKGTFWRVRAGPFASRGVAENTQGQIASKLNIKGNIVAQE